MTEFCWRLSKKLWCIPVLTKFDVTETYGSKDMKLILMWWWWYFSKAGHINLVEWGGVGSNGWDGVGGAGRGRAGCDIYRVLSKEEVAISKISSGDNINDRLESFSGRRIKGLRRIHMRSFDKILPWVTEEMQ